MTMVTLVCPNCGKNFTRRLANVHQASKRGIKEMYCSHRCSATKQENPKTSLEVRFNEKVIKQDGCWGWKGGRQSNGYGAIWYNGRMIHASRASWIIHRGPIPEGAEVMHICDNPVCSNPDHLMLGSHQQNMTDCKNKGRAGYISRPGESNPCAKLDEKKVIYLRQQYAGGRTIKSLAKELNINYSTAKAAISKQNWKHI